MHILRKITNKQSNFIPQGIRKRINYAQSKQKKEVIKSKAEINEIGARKNNRINKTKSWFFKIDKIVTTFTKKKKREDSNKIINERGDVIVDSTEIMGS